MRYAIGCALAALVLLGACGDPDGIVEVYWQFDDAKLERLFPLGEYPTTCEFESQSGIRYDLRVQLTIVENTQACTDDPTSAECQVIEPKLFPCNRFRGTALSVPVSANPDGDDPGYLMFVEAVIDPTDTPPFVPSPACLSGPGPRVRHVRPGRITDLEIYQFVFAALDVEALREAEDSDPGSSSALLIDIDACRPS